MVKLAVRIKQTTNWAIQNCKNFNDDVLIINSLLIFSGYDIFFSGHKKES